MKKMKWIDAQKEMKIGTVFLEFYTDWCGDCKMMNPIVENAEVELKDKEIKFIKVNAEEANLLRESKDGFEVLKVPSFFKVVDGNPKHIGYEYLPVETLIKFFK